MLMWNWQERIRLEERYHPIPVSITGGGGKILEPTPVYRVWMRKQKVAIRVGFSYLLLTFVSAIASIILRMCGL